MNYGRMRFVTGFLAIPVALYAIYVIAPYAQAFYIAFTDWRGVNATPRLVGLENFQRLFDDNVFWKAVGHNLILLILMPLLTIGIALFFAFLLNAGGRGGTGGVWGSRFYRVVFFFPQVLAVAVVAVLFQQVFRPDRSGMLNAPLIALGFEPVGFLSDTGIALWAILGVLVWQAVGFYVVLFSAGISSIPRDMFEAAAIDGAGGVQLFLRVTLPLLWDTIQVGWVYLGIAALDVFAIVWVMTAEHGGPDHSTTVMAAEIYRNAFQYFKFGYASAMGVVLFFFTIGFAALALRLSRRERIEF
ncbi:carbohydrate ABC transporter permease [Streptosporangium roseum]|uniref:Binding-protein-dependent transport systems inner membrane component n=1 Tax=Streptosporangium roseum (strain ATCC 12428 / DSM 43021 / JCM 3005 / KCTC 9067 / NCIMB 10171 / NRRL 2505 / NI 9100) TaxID=479432 RepID=D2AW80_STRRD|nr:sugar ABC transporter permease [Streptosporangium roseum]ACZ85033.1 binding-protein-dependent transport systems inner membrane component [Streptosporangium roseum DSM 43021]